MREKLFKTDSLAICPFLMLQGLKYLRAEVSLGKYDKPVVSFVFEDPHGVGRDLEIDFMKSDYKKYRDLSYFFRNEIEKLKRKMDKVQLDESRAVDERYADEHTKKDIKEG